MRKRRLPLPPLLAEFIETKGWRSRENSRTWKSFFPGGWRRRQIPFPSRSDSNREKTNACARAGPFPFDDGSLQALSLFHPTRRLPPLRGWFFANRADARSLPSIFFQPARNYYFRRLACCLLSTKVRQNEDLAIRKNIFSVGRKINYREGAFVKREREREKVFLILFKSFIFVESSLAYLWIYKTWILYSKGGKYEAVFEEKNEKLKNLCINTIIQHIRNIYIYVELSFC